MSQPPEWIAWTTAISAGASALILGAALFVALAQVGEARRLRKDQTRPFVVIDFDVTSVQPVIRLVIKNLGKTLARNVRFDFDPPLSSSFDKEKNLPRVSELLIFVEGIPTLVPGHEISLLFDSFLDRNAEEYPDRYRATLEYDGPEEAHYRDETVLDLGIYRSLAYVHRRGIHDIHERLKELRDVFKKWGAPSGGGILSVSPADQAKRNKEWEERASRDRKRPQKGRRNPGDRGQNPAGE